ncbi:MAG TPA: hypothetical protein DEO49_07990 [Sutterella sp.]|nr:hypothetical protein [Sutterella sp.]
MRAKLCSQDSENAMGCIATFALDQKKCIDSHRKLILHRELVKTGFLGRKVIFPGDTIHADFVFSGDLEHGGQGGNEQ